MNIIHHFAIRHSIWEKNNILYFISNLFINHYEDIIIYNKNIRKKLNLPLYDSRIFYHNNNYYIIALDGRNNQIIPNLNIINVRQFNISEFKKLEFF